MYEIFLDVSKLKLIDKGDTILIEVPSITYTSSISQSNKQNNIHHKNITNKSLPINNSFLSNSQNTQAQTKNFNKLQQNIINSTSNIGPLSSNPDTPPLANNYILKLQHGQAGHNILEADLQKLIIQHIDALQKQYDQLIKSKIITNNHQKQPTEFQQQQNVNKKEEKIEVQQKLRQQQKDEGHNSNTQANNKYDKQGNPFTSLNSSNSLFSNNNATITTHYSHSPIFGNNSNTNSLNSNNNNDNNRTANNPSFYSYNSINSNNTSNSTAIYQNQMNMFTKNAMKNSNGPRESIFPANNSLLSNPQNISQKWTTYQNNPSSLFTQTINNLPREGGSSLFGIMQNDGANSKSNNNKGKNGRKGLTFA